MVKNRAARHHLYKARVSRAPRRDFFTWVVYFFTCAAPLFELPQAFEIYVNHSAANVSIWTWGFFCIDNFIWLAYGIRKRLFPVVLSAILYEIIELSIFIGILRYN